MLIIINIVENTENAI